MQRPNTLRSRVEQAIAENRFQTGLDLARQLLKQEPSDAHREIVLKAVLGRARQLREQGATNDSIAMLDRACELTGANCGQLAYIAEEFANAGDYSRAAAVYNQIPEPRPDLKLAERVADALIWQGTKGRPLLPEAWRSDYDRIRSALTKLASGHDEEVRIELQSVSLQSAFLQWKLLIRGLLAFYQQDDPRALENWQRLDVKLLPARIAAMFRISIDTEFRTAQSPDTQRVLLEQADRLHRDTISDGLRRIRQFFGSQDGSGRIFSDLQQLIPNIRKDWPELLPKVANCYYWHVVRYGEFETGPNSYRKWFGSPAEDPELHRMQALMHESMKHYQRANHFWKLYADSLPRIAVSFAPHTVEKVQALIWHRMGCNARRFEEVGSAMSQAPFLPFGFSESRQKPAISATDCFRRSAELAPNWPAPLRELLDVCRRAKKSDEAIAAARKLLSQTPNDVVVVRELAEMLMVAGEYAEAMALAQRALSLNPLQKDIERLLAGARHFQAMHLASKRDFEGAERLLQAASQLIPNSLFLLTTLIAVRFLAGNDEHAESMLADYGETNPIRPAVAVFMLSLATKLKLKKALKSRFEAEFKAVLASEPSVQTAKALALAFADLDSTQMTYFGAQAQCKKVLTYVQKTVRLPYSIEDLRFTGTALLDMKEYSALKRFALAWKRQHRNAPEPLYFEAESLLSGKCDPNKSWRARRLLARAATYIDEMPPDPFLQGIQKSIHLRLEELRQMQAFTPFDFFAELDEILG